MRPITGSVARRSAASICGGEYPAILTSISVVGSWSRGN